MHSQLVSGEGGSRKARMISAYVILADVASASHLSHVSVLGVVGGGECGGALRLASCGPKDTERACYWEHMCLGQYTSSQRCVESVAVFFEYSHCKYKNDVYFAQSS